MEKKIQQFIAIFFLAVIMVNFFNPNIDSVLASQPEGQINIVYFYINPCASCDEEGEFIKLFNALVGEDKDDVKVNIVMYNVFHASGEKLAQEYFEKYDVPEEKRIYPILFINNEFISGSTAIREELRDAFLQEKNKIAIDPVVNREDIQTTILYFYVETCKDCEGVSEILDSIKEQYPVEFENEGVNTYVKVKKFNIGEPESLQLVKKYFEVYDVPEKDQSVPIIFIGDTYLSGIGVIRQELIQKIKGGEGIGTIDLSMETGNDIYPSVSLDGYHITGVLMAGLVNGLNPCSLSMLLFFLSLLVAKGKNVLKMGFAFCLGKFLAYLLLGTLFFNIFIKFQAAWFSTVVKAIILIVVFFIIVMNLGDYYSAKHEKYDKIRLQLPAILRKYNHNWIKKLSSIENGRLLFTGCFVLGIVISIGEFLCTGQIYLATILYVMRNSSTFNLHAFSYFILYALAFITPLLIVTCVIYKGREVFDVSDVIRERMPIIKLINAVLFFIFGLAVILWF